MSTVEHVPFSGIADAMEGHDVVTEALSAMPECDVRAAAFGMLLSAAQHLFEIGCDNAEVLDYLEGYQAFLVKTRWH